MADEEKQEKEKTEKTEKTDKSDKLSRNASVMSGHGSELTHSGTGHSHSSHKFSELLVSLKSEIQLIKEQQENMVTNMGIESVSLKEHGDKLQLTFETPNGPVSIPLHASPGVKVYLDNIQPSEDHLTVQQVMQQAKGGAPAGMSPEQLQEFKKQTLHINGLQQKVKELETKLNEAGESIKKGHDKVTDLDEKELLDVQDIWSNMDKMTSTLSEKIALQRVEMEKIAGDSPKPINYDPFNYGEPYAGDVVDFQARKRIIEIKLLLQSLQKAMKMMSDSVKISPEIDLGYKVVRLDELVMSTGFGAQVENGEVNKKEEGLLINQSKSREPGRVEYPKKEIFQTDDEHQSKWAITDTIMQTMYRLEVELGELQKMVASQDTNTTTKTLDELNQAVRKLKSTKVDAKYVKQMLEEMRENDFASGAMFYGRADDKADTRGSQTAVSTQDNRNRVDASLKKLQKEVKQLTKTMNDMTNNIAARPDSSSRKKGPSASACLACDRGVHESEMKHVESSLPEFEEFSALNYPRNHRSLRYPPRLRYLLNRTYQININNEVMELYSLPRSCGAGYISYWPVSFAPSHVPDMTTKFASTDKACDIKGTDGRIYKGDMRRVKKYSYSMAPSKDAAITGLDNVKGKQVVTTIAYKGREFRTTAPASELDSTRQRITCQFGKLGIFKNKETSEPMKGIDDFEEVDQESSIEQTFDKMFPPAQEHPDYTVATEDIAAEIAEEEAEEKTQVEKSQMQDKSPRGSPIKDIEEPFEDGSSEHLAKGSPLASEIAAEEKPDETIATDDGNVLTEATSQIHELDETKPRDSSKPDGETEDPNIDKDKSEVLNDKENSELLEADGNDEENPKRNNALSSDALSKEKDLNFHEQRPSDAFLNPENHPMNPETFTDVERALPGLSTESLQRDVKQKGPRPSMEKQEHHGAEADDLLKGAADKLKDTVEEVSEPVENQENNETEQPEDLPEGEQDVKPDVAEENNANEANEQIKAESVEENPTEQPNGENPTADDANENAVYSVLRGKGKMNKNSNKGKVTFEADHKTQKVPEWWKQISDLSAQSCSRKHFIEANIEKKIKERKTDSSLLALENDVSKLPSGSSSKQTSSTSTLSDNNLSTLDKIGQKLHRLEIDSKLRPRGNKRAEKMMEYVDILAAKQQKKYEALRSRYEDKPLEKLSKPKPNSSKNSESDTTGSNDNTNKSPVFNKQSLIPDKYHQIQSANQKLIPVDVAIYKEHQKRLQQLQQQHYVHRIRKHRPKKEYVLPKIERNILSGSSTSSSSVSGSRLKLIKNSF